MLWSWLYSVYNSWENVFIELEIIVSIWEAVMRTKQKSFAKSITYCQILQECDLPAHLCYTLLFFTNKAKSMKTHMICWSERMEKKGERERERVPALGSIVWGLPCSLVAQFLYRKHLVRRKLKSYIVGWRTFKSSLPASSLCTSLCPHIKTSFALVLHPGTCNSPVRLRLSWVITPNPPFLHSVSETASVPSPVPWILPSLQTSPYWTVIMAG